MNMTTMTTLIASLALTGVSRGEVLIDFNDLPLPGPDYTAGAGFTSEGVAFTGGVFWGWTYSDVNDSTTGDYTNQYAAYPGEDLDGVGSYAIGYNDGSYINLPAGLRPESAAVTNTTYAALTVRDGNQFSTAFGGASGDEPDLFTVTLTGYSAADGGGEATGSVEVVLADYRFSDNSLDYVLDSWLGVDLTPLGDASSIGLTFFSTDVGQWGINTPTYVALDNLVLVPSPSGFAVALLGGLALVTRRMG